MKLAGLLTYFRKNYIVAISGLVFAIALGYHFVRSEQITRLAADYDDLNVRRARILKNLKFGAELEADLERLRAMNEEVSERLFRPADLAANQRYFYQIESETGVALTSLQQIIKPLPTGKANKRARKRAEQSAYQEIAYDMGVTGTYEELVRFLRQVEGGEAFATLDGFSIVSAKNPVGVPKVDMRMTVNVLGNKQ